MSDKERTEKPLVSPKEHNQLVCSNKKIKRKITNWIFDPNPEGDAQMVDANLGETQIPLSQPSVPPNNPPSFKEMLNQKNFLSQPGLTDSFDQEDDDVSNDDTPPEGIHDSTHCPIILLSKEEKIQMRKPWRHSMIIKMFNGKVGVN